MESRGRGPRPDFLHVLRPFIDDDDVRAVGETLRSGWLTVGKKCIEFEEALKPVVGARHVHVVASCTTALEIALRALGIGRGDRVVTSPITFTATAAAILHAGAEPVLADVESDTGNLDPAKVERLLRSRGKIRALMPVHFAGHPCEMDPLLSLTRKRRLLVVEDAAHALTASYRGRPIGSIGDATCFSFFACKNLCTIEGGAIATNRTAVDRKARVLSLHGISRDAWQRYSKGGSWRYDVVDFGFKSNLTDVQAALGLSQLAKLARMQERREQIAARYTAAFAAEEALEPPTVRPHVTMAWHLYVLRLRPECLRINRDSFIEELRRRNIGTSVHFIPLPLFTFYRKRLGFSARAYPVAMDFFKRALTLPLYPSLTDRDVDDVITAVFDVVRRNLR